MTDTPPPAPVEQCDRPSSTDRECSICGAVVAAWPEVMVCHCQTVPWKRLAARGPALPVGVEAKPFGYWVEQEQAEPALLRKPAYIPEASDLRTVTPLYTWPAPTTPEAPHV